jgi:hypothetical protein
VLKNRTGENWCQNHLAHQEIFQLLEKVDSDLTQETRLKGCLLCGGKLHRSDYDRKPRGGPQWDLRFSLCCAKEGCRRRHTPPSVRFMGRRVYAGLVVVLVSAMIHGLKPARVELRVASATVRAAAAVGAVILLADYGSKACDEGKVLSGNRFGAGATGPGGLAATAAASRGHTRHAVAVDCSVGSGAWRQSGRPRTPSQLHGAQAARPRWGSPAAGE